MVDKYQIMIQTETNGNGTTQPTRLAELEEQRRIYKIRKFYKSLSGWATMSVVLIAIDLFSSQSITWSKWPVFFWGISIFIQFIQILRLQHFGKSWEERMIRRQGGHLVLPDTTENTEDYSDELLRKPGEPVKEKAELSEFRKLKKPWRDEDLV
jgi:hypothetical protein